MDNSPPPLKTKVLAAKITHELNRRRGDPVELRRLETAATKERGRVLTLERKLEDKEQELKTTAYILDLRIAELEKRLLQSQEENARFRTAVNPEDLGQFDDIMRVINRERVVNQKERKCLQAEREAFQAEKLSFERLTTDKVKQGFVLGVVEAAEASVIAQRVHEFVRRYVESPVDEIREIRESLEHVLEQKLAELEKCTYRVIMQNLYTLSVFN
jgi:hypothetical protein